MIFTDRSVWIDHLSAGDRVLEKALEERSILTHPFVIGEMLSGTSARATASSKVCSIYRA